MHSERLPQSNLVIALVKNRDDRFALLLKNESSSRKICTFDRRSSDVQCLIMVHEELMLAKLKKDDKDGDSSYWTLIDTEG